MRQASELARINLVLEMVSECAALVDAEGVRALVGSRLRWILDFERCELALHSNGALLVYGMGRGDESLMPLPGGLADAMGRPLMEEVFSSAAPASAGRPIASAAYPLGAPGSAMGALYLAAGEGGFSHRELRLVQHIGASLGAVLSRVESQAAAEVHRRDAVTREAQSVAERAARDEALSANAAKDAFLAMLGHELRNPLAPILASASLLRGELTGRSAARVDVIERQARHLDRLVGDLLDASRISNGKLSLRRAVTDLRDVVAKAVEMARPGADERRQRVEVDLPERRMLVDGDEARLAQVLSNLLNNASLYSPPGSAVSLAVEREGEEVVVTVSDRGEGMSAETLARAFDMFVQGTRSRELAPGGLGLGLGVARTIVELHGGRIDAYSAGEGLGSRFRAWLPAVGDDAVAGDVVAAGLAPRAPSGGAALKVLLVDDNVDAGDSMAEILRALGHEVLVAYEPAQALRIAPGFAPQVALLDIGMPIMSGHELASALRALLPVAPSMIALSGYGQERDLALSRDMGFRAHLVKPVNVSELMAALSPVAP